MARKAHWKNEFYERLLTIKLWPEMFWMWCNRLLWIGRVLRIKSNKNSIELNNLSATIPPTLNEILMKAHTSVESSKSFSDFCFLSARQTDTASFTIFLRQSVLALRAESLDDCFLCTSTSAVVSSRYS